MSEMIEHESEHIVKLTKKYIVDSLGALLFSNVIFWDGDDQYNEFPIFRTTIEGQGESEYRQEQRGALFIHKRSTKILRLSVVVMQSTCQSICYRLTGLKSPLKIDNRMHYPLETYIDFSAADLNIGVADISSYSLCDNTAIGGASSLLKLFTLLRFLLNSYLVTHDDERIFLDLIDAPLSLPPVISDAHYIPIFSIKDKSNEGR